MGEDHPESISRLSLLAGLALMQKHPHDADTMLKRVAAFQERTYGSQHPALAATLSNRGLALMDMGKHADAEEQFRLALQIYEENYGPNSSDASDVMIPLAGAMQGRTSEAEALYGRAITIAETAYGSHHPQLASALENYSNFLRRQNRGDEADTVANRAQTIRVKNMPGRSTS
jgi:tetratricopeptide (TPR) repeat protein